MHQPNTSTMYLLIASCFLTAAISWSAARWYYTSGEVTSLNGWRAFYTLLFIDVLAVIYIHWKWTTFVYSGTPWPVTHSTPQRQSPVRGRITEDGWINIPARHRVRDSQRDEHHEPLLGEHSSRSARQVQLPEDPEDMTVNDLKQVLKSKGYKQTGGKAELIYRLKTAEAAEDARRG